MLLHDRGIVVRDGLFQELVAAIGHVDRQPDRLMLCGDDAAGSVDLFLRPIHKATENTVSLKWVLKKLQ